MVLVSPDSGRSSSSSLFRSKGRIEENVALNEQIFFKSLLAVSRGPEYYSPNCKDLRVFLASTSLSASKV